MGSRVCGSVGTEPLPLFGGRMDGKSSQGVQVLWRADVQKDRRICGTHAPAVCQASAISLGRASLFSPCGRFSWTQMLGRREFT